MRTGRNPAKSGLEAYTPKELGVALILYIPSQDGYFANALEIFKMQIASLKAATFQPYDLLVFDNGSCVRAVVNALQELYKAGEITWLVLSRHNIGKAGAWNWIFAPYLIRLLPTPTPMYSSVLDGLKPFRRY